MEENTLEKLKDTINKENSSSTEVDKKTGEGKSKKTYTLYPIRWPMCIFFTTSIVASGLGMVGFTAISNNLTGIYGVSSLATTMLVLPFIFLFIPWIFPANYLIDTKGVVIPVYIASVTLLAGAWIRILVNTNFYFVIAGQVLMAIGQPFMLSAPAKLAALWFGDNERALATILGSLASPIGAVIGFLLPLLFIGDDDKNPTDDCKNKFEKYVLVQSIIITVLGLPIIFLIRNQPKTPPSSSAEKVLKRKRVGQWQAFKRLLQNRDYVFLMLSFSFIYSIYTTLGSWVGQISDEFGFQSSANSIFGTVYIFGGLVGSFTHAILLDKYKKYKIQYILIGIGCMLTLGGTTAIIGTGSVLFTAIILWLLGVAQLPIIGVAYSFSSELTYPINEALSWGFLQLIGSIVASVLTFAEGYLLSSHEKYIAWFVLIGSVTLGTFFQLFIRERLTRALSTGSRSSFSFHIGNTGIDANDNVKDNTYKEKMYINDKSQTTQSKHSK